MADVKRVVSISFWNDRKVCDEFSPEDKYFFLYLLTNPHTTQLGIYELPISKASEELGYSKESVKVLLDRFENKYKVIKYSHLTGEIAIRFFLKHSIVKGGKPVEDCLKKEYANVKDKDLVKYIYESLSIKNNLNETVVKFLNNIKVDLSNISINDNDNENERIVPRIVPRIVDTSEKKPDLEVWYEYIYKNYPKKSNYVSGQKAFCDFFKDIPSDEWTNIADDISEALKLYKKDYEKNYKDDKTYKYMQSIDKWLKDSAIGWIKEVEKNREKEKENVFI